MLEMEKTDLLQDDAQESRFVQGHVSLQLPISMDH